MTSCADILTEMKASPSERKYIERRVKEGGDSAEITEEIIQDIENQRFRDDSNELSKTNTVAFLDKLKQVSTKVKKPYNALFRFLVGDKSGITSRSLARAQARSGYFASKLRMPKYDVETLRTLAANEINKNNFQLILENYKIEFEESDFNFGGEWDPNDIKNIGQLKKEIIKGGDNFWGDHILLQLLQKKLKLNIIILNSNYTVHPMASLDLSENDKTIIIYYLDQNHFQLIGYYDGDLMKTLFKNDELPEIIVKVYNEDCRNNF